MLLVEKLTIKNVYNGDLKNKLVWHLIGQNLSNGLRLEYSTNQMIHLIWTVDQTLTWSRYSENIWNLPNNVPLFND